MSSDLSVADIIARLEAQVAVSREREAFHAQQEVFHREERGRHAADLEKLTRELETFKAAAASAAELATRFQPSAPDPKEIEELDTGRRPMLSRLAARVIEGIGPDERFGAKRVTQEINRRYGEILEKRTTSRLVSIALRRMAARKKIHVVRTGLPHRETLYVRNPPAPLPS